MDGLISFAALDGIKRTATDFTRFGNDYIFAKFDSAHVASVFPKDPVRVSGLTFCLLLKGNLKIEFDNRQIDLKPISVFFVSSATLLRIIEVSNDDIEGYILFLSHDFVEDLNIDHNHIKINSVISKEVEAPPVLGNLSENEIKMLSELMDLLHRNACLNPVTDFTHKVSKSLIQALIYQLLQLKENHLLAQTETDTRPLPRRMGYVHDFMRLVQAYYHQERSLQFYADRMYISPKYLSRLIKETTGRSAADWIDNFVVQEAKNLLRFSNKSIQQVAYALNFPTQSSFGKFFKHITGMSPSEYQQS